MAKQTRGRRPEAGGGSARASLQSPASSLQPVDATYLLPVECAAIHRFIESRAKEHRDRLTERNGQVVDVTVRFAGAVNVAAGAEKKQKQKPDLLSVIAALLAAIAPRSRGQAINAVTEQFAGWVNGGEEPEIIPEATRAAEDLLGAVTREVEKYQRGNVTAAVSGLVVSRLETGG